MNKKELKQLLNELYKDMVLAVAIILGLLTFVFATSYYKSSASENVVEQNNQQAQQEEEKIRSSVKEGEELTETENGFIIKRADGTIEKYEIISGFAGFTIIRTK